MKVPGFVVAMALCTCVLGDEVRLPSRYHSVYILEMSNALDQHLASRISNAHVMWVTLDPTGADLVLTDTVDAAFWLWMQRTYATGDSGGSPTAGRGGVAKVETPPAGNHRGTLFLVDPRRRVVVWSTYTLAKGPSPTDLDRAATRVAGQLKVAFGKK